MAQIGVLEHYHDLLNVPQHIREVTLLEGGTPLIPLPALRTSLEAVLNYGLKFEGMNPTGSLFDICG